MIYTFLAPGFEEVEALTPVDLLRRCELQVTTVGIGGKIIQGSHGISVVADVEDKEISSFSDAEMIILPGGMPGTLNLEASPIMNQCLDFCFQNKKWIAAICAAPSVLGRKGLLKGKKAVCFEGFESQLFGAEVLYDSVCVDDHFITARGAGVALDFALKLVEMLISKERSETLGASMQCIKK